MRTLLHLSDVHFGRFDAALLDPLLRAAAAIRPDLVAVSGDLTQRARPEEFRQAREFLDALPQPRIVVPGNHDVPLHNVYARIYRPLANYRRFVTHELQPFYADAEIAVLGMNTARSLIWKNGRVNARQIACIQDRFCAIGGGVTKALVTHHPFDLPARHGAGDLVGGARLAMKTIAACGLDLLLAGHFHVGDAGRTAARYRDAGHSAIFVQAGTLSTRGRGQANSFNAIRIEAPGAAARSMQIERYAWDQAQAAFVGGAPERYEFGPEGWTGVSV